MQISEKFLNFFFRKYNQFCKKFKKKHNEKEIFNNIAEKHTYTLRNKIFKISEQQIQRARLSILIFYFLSILILKSILNYSNIVSLFFVVLGIFINSYLKNVHLKKIKEYQNRYINYYLLLGLEISILSSSKNKSFNKKLVLLKSIKKYPKLSVNFQKMYSKINRGYPIKKGLEEIIFFCPIFNSFFHKLIENGFSLNNTQDFEKLNKEYQSKFENYLKDINNFLPILFFISVFFPVILVLISTIYSNKLEGGLVFLTLFLITIEFLTKKITKMNFSLFISKNKELKQEFKAFLHLMNKVTENLVLWPPTVAFYNSIISLNEWEKKILNINQMNYLGDLNSFEELFRTFFNENIRNKQIIIIGTFYEDIFKKGMKKSHKMLFKSVNLLEKHSESSKKREKILSDSYFKIKFFKILLSFVLGILSPVFIIFSHSIFRLEIYFTINENITKGTQNMISLIILFGILNLMSLIITLRAYNKIYKMENTKKLDFLIIVLYISCFIISYLLFSNFVII